MNENRWIKDFVSCILFCLVLASCAPEKTRPSAANAERYVARIINWGKTKGIVSTGTGFFVTPDTLVSNAHVVEGADSLLVAYRNANSVQLVSASVKHVDSERDLAVITAAGMHGTPLGIPQDPVQAAEDVWAVGYPGIADNGEEIEKLVRDELAGSRDEIDSGKFKKELSFEKYSNIFGATISKGTVIKLATGTWETGTQRINLIYHDAKISGGNSGGPLVNETQSLVGVNTQVRGTNLTSFNFKDNYYLASNRSEVSSILAKQGVAFHAAISEESRGFFGTLWFLIKIILIGLVVIVAIALAMGKREQVLQMMRRAAAMLKRGIAVGKPAAVRFSRRVYQMADQGITRMQKAVEEAGKKEATSNQPDSPPAPAKGRHFVFTPTDSAGADGEFIISERDLTECGGRILLGRKADRVNLRLDDDSISRQHATLAIRSGVLGIEDRNSSNGVTVRGSRLQPFTWCEIYNGDIVVIGELEFRVNEKS